MSIENIAISDFRNIKHLKFSPADVNIVYGSSRTGKTSFLDAIAYTNSNDVEFHSLLRGSYGTSGRSYTLDSLIRLNFFTHEKDLEFFKVYIKFRNQNSNRFEIWKTDPSIARLSQDSQLVISPFLYVFESIDPTKIIPRTIPHSILNRTFKAINGTNEEWPVHYVGLNKTCTIENFHRYAKTLSPKPAFKKTLTSFVEYFDEVDKIVINNNHSPNGIMVKYKDRKSYVPIYTCSDSMIRMLSILFFLHRRAKTYFLIDDLERGLTDEELFWMISEICHIAEFRSIQLFVTTKRSDVVQAFNECCSEIPLDIKYLDLNRFKTSAQEVFATV